MFAKHKKRSLKLILIMVATPWLLHGQDTFTWNGDGVVGGTTSNAWSDPGNWLVNGLSNDLELLPGVLDTVILEFNKDRAVDGEGDYINSSAVFIPNGAMAGNVQVTNHNVILGTTESPARALIFAEDGNFTFSTLDFTTTAANKVEFLSGATLTLTGAGTPASPTLSVFQTTNTAWLGTPTIIFEAENVAVAVPYNPPLHYRFTNTSPDATIHLSEFLNQIGNSIEFRPNQTITGVNHLTFRAGASSITNGAGGSTRLTNFSDLGIEHFRSSGGSPTLSVAAADIRYLTTYSLNGQSGGLTTTLNGDFRIVGGITDHPSIDLDFSLYVSRQGRGWLNATTGHVARVTVSTGSTLTVEDPAFTAYIGDPVYNQSSHLVPAYLTLLGATAIFHGDLVLGYQGSMNGNVDSILQLHENFQNQSRIFTGFSMAAATVHLAGSGTSETPQFFEVHGIDFGENSAGYTNNFAWGHMIVGSPEDPTYVHLVDLFDHGPAIDFAGRGEPDGLPDALYLDQLTVHPGSTLFLNYLNVYVDGVLLNPDDPSFDPEDFGGGLIIVPEPALFPLLLAALAATVIGYRRRTS